MTDKLRLPPAPDEISDPDLSLPEARAVDLRQTWHTLVKRRVAIIVTCVTVLAAAILGSFLTRPIYRAVTTIQIERENPNILSFQEIQLIDTNREDFYRTHLMLLQSRSLMRRVIEQARLAEEPEFAPTDSDLDAETRESRLVSRLLQKTKIDPIRRSRLFRIGVETQDPQLSADIANTISQAYIEMSVEARFEATQGATAFLSAQIESLRKEIQEKRQALQAYAEQNEIVSLDDQQNITVQRLTGLNSELTKTQVERMERESSYAALKQILERRENDGEGGIDLLGVAHIPAVANNHLIQTLLASKATLETRYIELGQRFQEDWPEMIRLRQRTGELARQIRSEQRRIVAGVVRAAEADYRASLGRERLLRQQLDEQKESVSEMNRSAITYNNLKAEVDNKSTLLDSLMKRKNETDVSARLKGLGSSNVRVVDPAEPPFAPSRPNKKVNAVIGLVFGLALGIGVAFFLEFLDNTIKSVEDIERYTGLPSFGVIPMIAAEDNERALGDGREKDDSIGSISDSLVTLADARSAVSEAYRTLRTSVLLSTPGHPPRSLLVTSSQAGEGKTTTVVNTAIALAQAGKQVLLIDADLRRPRCHKLLGLHNKSGLSTFLAGSSQLKSLVQVTPVRNLFVLTSGPIPPNPSELLGSERMAQLLRIVPPGINHILLDSPPVLSVTDPMLCATLVDGVMLVVRSGKTPWQLLKRSQRRIRDVNARVLGVVLNSVEARNADYYSYRYTSSEYAYGEDEA